MSEFACVPDGGSQATESDQTFIVTPDLIRGP
jgi:hypothetical protein